jgi:hypothetical protein
MHRNGAVVAFSVTAPVGGDGKSYGGKCPDDSLFFIIRMEFPLIRQFMNGV